MSRSGRYHHPATSCRWAKPLTNLSEMYFTLTQNRRQSQILVFQHIAGLDGDAALAGLDFRAITDPENCVPLRRGKGIRIDIRAPVVRIYCVAPNTDISAPYEVAARTAKNTTPQGKIFFPYRNTLL